MTSPEKNGFESRAARSIATVGGLGDLLPAAGTTAGSLPAALVWWVLAASVERPLLVLAITACLTVAATVAGVWASDLESARRGAGDPQPIVIDEVAGQWLAFLVSWPFVVVTGGFQLVVFTGAGFLLFRIFDVAKPWPVGRLEKIPGGKGIVADDLAAGLLAGILLAIGWRLFGGMIGA
jgi:phosphatidylglycerophosphatase A